MKTKYTILTRAIMRKMGLNVKSRYQTRTKSYKDQFLLIENNIDFASVQTALDIGCNQGMLAKKLASGGIFTIGIDTLPKFLKHSFNEPSPVAFCYWKIDQDTVKKIPSVDLVLLFSVHHYWVKRHGDDFARTIVQSIVDKANKYFIIEFPSRAEKFGYKKDDRFIDNDEQTIKQYAKEWLSSLSFDGDIKYIGKNRMGGSAPARYLFLLSKEVR